MRKTELEVIRINEDVIATSVDCTSSTHYYIFDVKCINVGNPTDVHNMVLIDDGEDPFTSCLGNYPELNGLDKNCWYSFTGDEYVKCTEHHSAPVTPESESTHGH